MGANIAGIYGAQIFRADDKPLYRRGFSIGIGVLTFGTILAIVRYIDDRIRRKRNAGLIDADASSGHQSDEKSDSKTAVQNTVQPQQSIGI